MCSDSFTVFQKVHEFISLQFRHCVLIFINGCSEVIIKTDKYFVLYNTGKAIFT